MEDPPLARILEKHPSLKGLLRRHASTGCLEYIGPKHGRLDGNPPVYIKKKGRNGVVLLRAQVWRMFHGMLPGGKIVLMRCGHHACHNPDHMIAANRRIVYRKRGRSPAGALDEEDIRRIRYFRGRAPTIVLERLFGIPSETLVKIQTGKRRGAVVMPPGYRPSRAWLRKVEQEAMRCPQGLALAPHRLSRAEGDIREGALKGREREILMQTLHGTRLSALAKTYGIPGANVYFIRQRALVRLWRTLGPREWIRMASKGKIEKWEKSWPVLKSPRK